MNWIFPECGCNMEGSTSNVCDQTTGACTCKPGWLGDKCEGKLKTEIYSRFQRIQMQLSWIHNYSVSYLLTRL